MGKFPTVEDSPQLAVWALYSKTTRTGNRRNGKFAFDIFLWFVIFCFYFARFLRKEGSIDGEVAEAQGGSGALEVGAFDAL